MRGSKRFQKTTLCPGYRTIKKDETKRRTKRVSDVIQHNSGQSECSPTSCKRQSLSMSIGKKV